MSHTTINKPYIISGTLLMLVVPAVCIITELMIHPGTKFSMALAGKWAIFSAVGLRLFIAGLKQIFDPAFTSQSIFGITDTKSFAVVRELGFSNICFGLTGILSLFFPGWRIAGAFASGLYYGLAGFMHLIKKPEGINEKFALVSDLFIFIVLAVYFIVMI